MVDVMEVFLGGSERVAMAAAGVTVVLGIMASAIAVGDYLRLCSEAVSGAFSAEDFPSLLKGLHISVLYALIGLAVAGAGVGTLAAPEMLYEIVFPSGWLWAFWGLPAVLLGLVVVILLATAIGATYEAARSFWVDKAQDYFGPLCLTYSCVALVITIGALLTGVD